MNVYACTDHDGYFPVGVASVVVANDEAEARELMVAALKDLGLKAHEPFTLTQISTDEAKAYVLRDGNY